MQDWRPLVMAKDIALQFRFLGRELEIYGQLSAESSISRIIDILTIPCERKKWDLRLVDMEPFPEENGYVFTYLSDRTLYEFHTNIIKVVNSTTCGNVEFKTTCYEFKQKNSILGNFYSNYLIETVEDGVSSTSDSETTCFNHGEVKGVGKVKVTWNSHFCEASYALVRGDLFQEADILKKSFELFISAAENKQMKIRRENSANFLLDTIERKTLSKIFSLEGDEISK